MTARLLSLAKSLLKTIEGALALFVISAIIGMGLTVGAIAAASFLAKPARAADISIPRAALPHKAALIRAAHAEMGLDAPVALLAAQVHTESLWRTDAVSPVGAQGLAQFMPSTARWVPTIAPDTGEPLPFNPGWALRALCAYDRWLFNRVKNAASLADRWAFALVAYNGGEKWRIRDQGAAVSQGRDPARYWGSVEYVNSGRKASAFKENREYPRRIFGIQGVYERAGWGPSVTTPSGVACRG